MIIQTELGLEKLCARCHEFWPADTEFFHRKGTGLHSYCKACVTERCRELRLNKRMHSTGESPGE